MCTHPYRLCLKAIILANRPDSRPWMCLVMCIVWLSHDIWSVLDRVFMQCFIFLSLCGKTEAAEAAESAMAQL